MNDELKFDPDALRKEFADYCTEVEPGIKAKAPRLNQLETLALIGMTVFQAAKELKHEKAASIAALEAANARIAELEAAAKTEPIYQLQQVNGAWLDVSKDKFDAIACNYGQVVYTAPAAALAQPLEAQVDARWQPIETAPKDGTPLILFARSIKATASIPIFGWFLDEYGWIAQSFHGIEKIVPSHWMPRPEFPAQKDPQ